MLVKGIFKKVTEIRQFTTRDGKTKHTVQYLIEAPYTRRDGSAGANNYLVDVVYDNAPQLVVGDINDPDTYEFELFFKVNASRDNPNRLFQNILCTKVSKSIV